MKSLLTIAAILVCTASSRAELEMTAEVLTKNEPHYIFIRIYNLGDEKVTIPTRAPELGTKGFNGNIYEIELRWNFHERVYKERKFKRIFSETDLHTVTLLPNEFTSFMRKLSWWDENPRGYHKSKVRYIVTDEVAERFGLWAGELVCIATEESKPDPDSAQTGSIY